MIRIFRSYFNLLSKWVAWFWQQEGSAAYRARGLAIGVFCGCFPFFGLQSLLGITLAGVFRGNYLLAALGTWISNPITYLPLYWFNYYVGSFLLGQKVEHINLNELSRENLLNQGLLFSTRILIGSSVVGCIFSLILGLVSYSVFVKLSRKRDM